MNGLGLKDGYILFLLVIVGKKYVHKFVGESNGVLNLK